MPVEEPVPTPLPMPEPAQEPISAPVAGQGYRSRPPTFGPGTGHLFETTITIPDVDTHSGWPQQLEGLQDDRGVAVDRPTLAFEEPNVRSPPVLQDRF